jgi:Zn-dependent peptidase ImmA (M78 family)
VRLVTVAQLATATGWSLEECRRTDGAWLYDTKTIDIRSSLPAKQRRYVLGHELLHAVNDWIGYELGVRRMEA